LNNKLTAKPTVKKVYLKAKTPRKRTGNTQKTKFITNVLLKNSNIFNAFLINVLSYKERCFDPYKTRELF
jgi:hypothetical protein